MTAARLTLAFLAGAAIAAPATATLRRRHSSRAAGPAAVAVERAALKHLGVLAGSAPPERLFAAMAEELARIVDRSTGKVRVEMALIGRFEPDGTLLALATWGRTPDRPVAVGSRWPLDGENVNARVRRTGRPARRDDYVTSTGTIGRHARRLGVRSAVCVPIVVDGELWGGATVLSTRRRPLPPDTEARAADFAELAATAISNTQARAKARRLSDEQAALRRVAVLVAQGVDPDEVFRAVVTEAGLLCGADSVGMVRYTSAEATHVVATWSTGDTPEQIAGRWPLRAGGLAPEIARTGRPGRIDDWDTVPGEIAEGVRDHLGYRSSVATPIHAEGRLWGMLALHSAGDEPFPPETERRLGDFADLVATSISNASARAEVRRLAEEQAALRRTATFVARQPPLDEVFARVVEELGRLLDVEDVRLLRAEPEARMRVMAAWGRFADRIPVGTTAPVADGSVAERVLRTRAAARADDPAHGGSVLATDPRETGVRSSVGAPVLVRGQLWGALIVSSLQPGPLPAAVTERLSDFAELVATAITNTTARADLAASRARIVVATDEARRRFERDLHDGAQQRLVSLALELRGVEEAVPPQLGDVRTHLAGIGDELDGVLDDLRELSRGLHPAILSEGGLRPALRALARRSVVPVLLEVDTGGRFSERIEVAAYYVVSEALANVAKHAGAGEVAVTVVRDGSALVITVADDGVGGADPSRGSGLTGIVDRVEALGGAVHIASTAGAGTVMRATLPVDVAAASRQ